MYFVTGKQSGYVLFAATPSERGAVGLTPEQRVRVLCRDSRAQPFRIIAEWPAAEFSHTDFMLAWHRREEPADPQRLLDVLPAGVRPETP